MIALMTENAFRDFSNIASPFLNLKDERHYLESLELIERLMQESEDVLDAHLNPVIEMLGKAIEEYENKDEELIAFEKEAGLLNTDVSVLKVLMHQHNLGVNDLPEIGSKSMVSRVLNGKRELNKKHIRSLSERFDISPSIFF